MNLCKIFLTKARGNTLYLPKRHQKLIADLFHLDTRVNIQILEELYNCQNLFCFIIKNIPEVYDSVEYQY